jgi:hypothetical protein
MRYEIDKSERGFESVPILLFSDHERSLPKCIVADIPNAQDESVDSVEDIMQENQSKNSDEQDYEKSNAESEGNSADVTAMDEGNKNKEIEKISDNNSESDYATIECVFDSAYDNGISDEDYDNGKNEKLNSAKTGVDGSSTNQRDCEDKTKKSRTEQNKDDGCVSVIGLGDDDIELAMKRLSNEQINMELEDV